MDASKLQAQVRSLTRDVGALREELRQEQKKRERLAAGAKASEEGKTAAEARLKQLTYVNTKLEQELRTVRERAEVGAAKSRAGLETLRGRLAEVERSVHQRSEEAQRQVQRVHSLVQDLQAAAMPLAVAAAAAAPPGMGCVGRPAPAPALKSPLPPGVSRSAAAAAVQHVAVRPEQLHRQFAQVFSWLSQLAALFAGGSGSSGSQAEVDASAVANPAPLLLTAPDGSTRSVHWQDQRHSGSPASSAGASAAAGSAAPRGSQAAAGGGSGDSEKVRLATEVQRLRGALSEARQRGAVATAAAAAAAATTSASGPGSGRVEAAMRQLEAVVPQYRAAAQALQGQVTVLKEKLAAASRERAALQEEVAKWQGVAQKHEAAFAEAAARLHAREAQQLAASTQVQSQTDRLQSDVDGLRRRCSELAARLQESQRALAQTQAAQSAKEKLAATQQQTIRQLEATIREQQADIRSALDLVTYRGQPACGSTGGSRGSSSLAGAAAPLLPDDEDAGVGGGSSYDYLGGSTGAGWAAAVPLDPGLEAGGSGWGPSSCSDLGMGPGTEVDDFQLASLMDAAQAAADAATAWAGSYGSDAGGAAAVAADDCWAADGYLAQAADDTRGVCDDVGAAWSIPAVGPSAGASWLPPSSSALGSPQRCTRPSSPGKAATAHKQSQQCGNAAQAAQSAGRSLQGSPRPLGAGLDALESDIAELEGALRSALCDLHV